MTWIVVLLGGAAGSAARHGVNMATTRLLGYASPYATAAVNLSGSFVIGLLAGAIAADRISMPIMVRTFVFVGILGGFTTFSSFMLDTLTLMESSTGGAVANLFGQLMVGALLVYAGYRVGLGH